MGKRNPIILIHGLWNTSSIFSSITSKLDDAGIEYYAPTLSHSYGMTSINDLTILLNEFILEKFGLEKELDSSRQKREQQLEQLGQEKEKLRKTVLFRDEAKDALSESRLQWSATRRSIETEQRQLERESRELKDLSGQIRNSTWCCCSSHRVRRERLLLSIISLTRQHTHTQARREETR